MRPYQVLETKFAEFLGLDPSGMVVCSSGTAALHLGLEGLQLSPGSSVVVPDYTMVACPRAVALAGLVPIFVDCTEHLLMNPDLGRAVVVDHSPSAIMAVHIYGRVCDMEKLSTPYRGSPESCPWIIEDLAEAHGIKPYRSTDVACWSFFRNKIVAGEEGGAVWFRDPERAKLARGLRCLGFTESHDYTHTPRGHNYRMSDLHAEWILSRRNVRGLWNYEMNRKGRRNVVGWYDEACPKEWRMPERDADWVYDVRIPGLTRREQTRVVGVLNDAGVAARHGFWPMSSQREFLECRKVGGGKALRLAPEVIYLPVQPESTTEEDCRRAMDLLRSAGNFV